MNLDIPKVELHVHLDGSVRIKTIAELASISEEEAQIRSVASSDCCDLTEYLTYFDLPCAIMQTKENLERIAKELGEDLVQDSVIYAEVRFFPFAHTKNGLSPKEVIEAVLKGFGQVDIPIKLILCMMRHESLETNTKIIRLAKEFLNHGVVAIDLAGDESKYETASFLPLFELAKDLKVPFTVHAGESASYESIKSAVEMGATRIGHGVRALESKEVMALLKEKNILLEMCPTSNIQTKVIQNIKDYPLWNFYQLGIPVSINTDNRTVSFTNLKKEYALLTQEAPITLKDFCEMNKMAIRKSFLSEEEKKLLIYKVNSYLKQFSR